MTAEPATVSKASEKITYTIEVRNDVVYHLAGYSAGSSRDYLWNVYLSDPMFSAAGISVQEDVGPLYCWESESPSRSKRWTGTYEYTVTPEDIARGRIVNTATASSECDYYVSFPGIPGERERYIKYISGTDSVTVYVEREYSVKYDWSGLPEQPEHGDPLPTLPEEGRYVFGATVPVDTEFTEDTVYEVKDESGVTIERYRFSGWSVPNDGKMARGGITITGTWTKFLVEDDYDWDNAAWTWADNCATAAISIPRLVGNGPALSQTVPAYIIKLTKPTCEQAGTWTCRASVTVLGHSYEDTRTVTTDPPLGHDWDGDGEVIPRALEGRTVTVYCLNDPTHTRTAQLTETENTVASHDPDCKDKTDGVKVYDRQFILDGVTYHYDRLEINLPWSGSHTWGDWTKVAGTETGDTYERECSKCGAKETSSHLHRWVLPDNTTPGDTDYVKWTLGPEDYTVTVTVTCSEPGCEDSPMEVVIGADAFEAAPAPDSFPATCTEDGQMVYQVTLALPGVGGQEVSRTYKSKSVPLPKTGHDWGEPKFTFAQDNGAPYDASETCTMTLTCDTCGETVSVSAGSIGSTVTKAPTCTEAGEAEVTATAVYDGVTYTSGPQTRTLSPTGHNYTSAAAVWADNCASAVVTFTCGNDPTHTVTETVTAASAETTPAACETDGVKTWTADATDKAKELDYSGKEPVFTVLEAIPATGHDWNTDTVTAGVDGDQTTVTITCRNDERHTRTVEASLTVDEIKDATCTAEGTETLQMTYVFEGKTYELEPDKYDIPQKPHTWGPWTESTDASGNVTTRTCTVCGETIPPLMRMCILSRRTPGGRC